GPPGKEPRPRRPHRGVRGGSPADVHRDLVALPLERDVHRVRRAVVGDGQQVGARAPLCDGLAQALERNRNAHGSLADHHLGGLDDRHHGVAHLETETLDRALRDHRHDLLTADVHHDLAHDGAGGHLLHLAPELLARGDLHGALGGRTIPACRRSDKTATGNRVTHGPPRSSAHSAGLPWVYLMISTFSRVTSPPPPAASIMASSAGSAARIFSSPSTISRMIGRSSESRSILAVWIRLRAP